MGYFRNNLSDKERHDTFANKLSILFIVMLIQHHPPNKVASWSLIGRISH
ncbi:hypothetical protein [Lapidilactobacillus gannanensis]|jgi:hypothetical protein|uniref:Transposase n=1 Tax=Lapidilactobacillus gannanensis TaxID=2486002 RepID=A0ABW4BME0_9LACO|nr:hypothetical protein [Lapidilactobacillus gannanensis]